MSKGFGWVQREIARLLDENPEDAFRVDELCWEIYGWQVDGEYRIEKKWRVSVIRAAKALVKKRADLGWLSSSGRAGSVALYHWASVMSYALAQLKCQHTDNEAWYLLRKNEEYAKHIAPGGRWWRHVQEWIAERDGDTAKLEELRPLREAEERESRAQLAAMMAMFKRG